MGCACGALWVRDASHRTDLALEVVLEEADQRDEDVEGELEDRRDRRDACAGGVGGEGEWRGKGGREGKGRRRKGGGPSRRGGAPFLSSERQRYWRMAQMNFSPLRNLAPLFWMIE